MHVNTHSDNASHNKSDMCMILSRRRRRGHLGSLQARGHRAEEENWHDRNHWFDRIALESARF